MSGKPAETARRTRAKNNAGTVYCDRNGRWHAAITVGPGKRKSWSAATEAEVRAKLQKGLAEHQAGLNLFSADQTLATWITTWLQGRTDVRPWTVDNYRRRLAFAQREIGGVKLSNLEPAHIQRVLTTMREKDYAPSMLVMVLTTLKTCLREAVQWGYLAKNPAELVRSPHVPRSEFRTLTPGQAKRLLAALSDHRLYALYVLLLRTGMRVGEATGLVWEDIDWTDASLRIQRTFRTLPGGGWTTVEPKTASARRTIYLSPDTVAALRTHQADQAGPIPLAHWVFRTEAGEPVRLGTVDYVLQQGLKRAGLKRIRVHDLRHTAATTMLAQGVPIKVVSEMLGHAQISMTLDLYAHALPSMHRDAVLLLDRAYRG